MTVCFPVFRNRGTGQVSQAGKTAGERWKENSVWNSRKKQHIKGLAEGLDLDKNTKEGKLIDALIGLCGEMADEITTLSSTVEYLDQYVSEVDEDLGDLEDVVFDDEDDDEDDEDDDDEITDEDCDGNCAACGEDCEFAGEDDDDEYYEIVCPSCGETVCFDASLADKEMVCPACGEKFDCVIEEEKPADKE